MCLGIQLGAQAYQQILQKNRVDRNEAVVAPVEQVGRHIAAAADRPDFDWRFVVIDAPKTVNAFCLPGGKCARDRAPRCGADEPGERRERRR